MRAKQGLMLKAKCGSAQEVRIYFSERKPEKLLF